MAGIWRRPGPATLGRTVRRGVDNLLPQRVAVTNAKVIDEIKTNPRAPGGAHYDRDSSRWPRLSGELPA